MKLILFTIALTITLAASAQKKNFDRFSADFVRGYQALHMPGLELSYVAGLQHI